MELMELLLMWIVMLPFAGILMVICVSLADDLGVIDMIVNRFRK